MTRTTLAVAVLLLTLFAIHPPVADAASIDAVAADARQASYSSRWMAICHLDSESQGTLIVTPALAFLHLLLHPYDYYGVCDVLPS